MKSIHQEDNNFNYYVPHTKEHLGTLIEQYEILNQKTQPNSPRQIFLFQKWVAHPVQKH